MLNIKWFVPGVLHFLGVVCTFTGAPIGTGYWGPWDPAQFDSPDYSPDLYTTHLMARIIVSPPPQVTGCIYAHHPRNSPDRSLIPRELVYHRHDLDLDRFQCMGIPMVGIQMQNKQIQPEKGFQALCHSESCLGVSCTLGIGAGGQLHHNGCNSSQVPTTSSGEMREPSAA